ncbi:MAG: alanine racemase, alanine racemase [Candidatus Peregrinibacteria bacterium GW2011_GWF2_33_10]|nr:MAG: alanine racemase, alanine racemase [Candidatus Peregrinibacteria bacterium GW2011_GWF2_33_10]OGJ45316.1 MAG: alanine racemase [Candidatus Peregrinibacteria bacterium RIFOXYA12_FULL_33_12]
MTTWIEISATNLKHNIQTFKKIIGEKTILAPAVKGNAYGHGLEICAKIMIKAGTDFLSVFSVEDLERVRKINTKIPILILGYVKLNELKKAITLNPNFVVWNTETLENLGQIAKEQKKEIFIHLKLETGNHRYGIDPENIDKYLKLFRKYPNLKLAGLASHFANVEDTTDHSYAEQQLQKFTNFCDLIEQKGFKVKLKHLSNSAAATLWKKAHFNLVRTGILNYGLWPSQEVFKTINLKPVMTWKTIISQIREIPENEYIGYGCTYKTTRKTKMAVLPIGYYDGYDRKLSNKGCVLIKGKRAKILGRICMNVTMVDITDIKNVKLEDEAVLLGKQGTDEIPAEEMASWANTINYEITTRINERIRRIVV